MMKLNHFKKKDPYVIILGLDSIQGLQSIRILARRGVPVIGIARNPTHFGCKTRYAEKVLVANTKTEEFIELLERLGPNLEHKAVLLPCTDTIVLLLSQNRKRLESWFHIILPPNEIVEMMMDKVQFYAFAQKEGLPIPKTFFLRNRADVEAVAGQLVYPAVLKPNLKTLQWDQRVREKVLQVKDHHHLLALYDRWGTLAPSFTVQQWINGGIRQLYACNCYFDTNGNVRGTFVSRKIRQWPPETGIGSLREEVHNDSVVEQTVCLFEKVGYQGLGYVEVKQDEYTGEQYIIEPNVGRPTGGSSIAEAGGVELLYSMYCDAIGWELPAQRLQHDRGVKWIYLNFDIRSAFTSWRNGELTLNEWRKSLQGPKTFTVFSWSDPLPFLYEIWSSARALLIKSTQRKR